MKVNVICVAYQRPISLQILIGSFIVQTNPNWILHIIYDGLPPKEIMDIVSPFTTGDNADDRIRFSYSEERLGNYGHPNRKMMLNKIETSPNDYILMTNDDNYYVPVFIEKILSRCNSHTGFVYWDTVHSHFDYNVLKSVVKVDRIDVGSFMVLSGVAKKVGFNHFQFNGDGFYAEECALECIKRGLKLEYITRPLFIHN